MSMINSDDESTSDASGDAISDEQPEQEHTMGV